MKVSTHITSGVLLVGGCAKLAMAGMGIDGGFDADMLIHFPGFFRAPRAATGNTFAFASALGGAAAEPVTATGDATRPFSCNGNTFTTFLDAATRSCNDQQNACSDIANSGSKNTAGITVAECKTQETSCIAAASSGPQTAASTTSTTSTTSSTTSTSSTSTTSTTAAQVQQTTTAVVVQSQTTTAVQVQPQTTTAAVAVPVLASSSTPVVVASPSSTLHSSDENFFYFCDV